MNNEISENDLYLKSRCTSVPCLMFSLKLPKLNTLHKKNISVLRNHSLALSFTILNWKFTIYTIYMCMDVYENMLEAYEFEHHLNLFKCTPAAYYKFIRRKTRYHKSIKSIYLNRPGRFIAYLLHANDIPKLKHVWLHIPSKMAMIRGPWQSGCQLVRMSFLISS